jgi:hypothetical protein
MPDTLTPLQPRSHTHKTRRLARPPPPNPVPPLLSRTCCSSSSPVCMTDCICLPAQLPDAGAQPGRTSCSCSAHAGVSLPHDPTLNLPSTKSPRASPKRFCGSLSGGGHNWVALSDAGVVSATNTATKWSGHVDATRMLHRAHSRAAYMCICCDMGCRGLPALPGASWFTRQQNVCLVEPWQLATSRPVEALLPGG